MTTHLDGVTRAWLAAGPDADVPRMPDELARRLLRLEEYEHAHRDQWGNWEFAFSEANGAGRLWEPDIDRWLLDRRRELDPAAEPPWPGRRPFAICLSHDVDLIADAVTPRQALRSMRPTLRWFANAVRRSCVLRGRSGISDRDRQRAEL